MAFLTSIMLARETMSNENSCEAMGCVRRLLDWLEVCCAYEQDVVGLEVKLLGCELLLLLFAGIGQKVLAHPSYCVPVDALGDLGHCLRIDADGDFLGIVDALDRAGHVRHMLVVPVLFPVFFGHRAADDADAL